MLWYIQCVSVGGDLTHHRYTLRGLVSQKCWGFSVKMFMECRLILPKVEGALCERDVGRVLVDFTKSRGFHKIVVNRVRVDFVKVQGVVCKIDIHKVWGLFYKIIIHRLWVDFRKVWDFFFCKIYIPTVSRHRIGRSDGRSDLRVMWAPSGARECTKISRKD